MCHWILSANSRIPSEKPRISSGNLLDYSTIVTYWSKFVDGICRFPTEVTNLSTEFNDTSYSVSKLSISIGKYPNSVGKFRSVNNNSIKIKWIFRRNSRFFRRNSWICRQNSMTHHILSANFDRRITIVLKTCKFADEFADGNMGVGAPSPRYAPDNNLWFCSYF